MRCVVSWSIDVVGVAQSIEEECVRYLGTLTGTSYKEFEAALPHLVSLVKLNFGVDRPPGEYIAHTRPGVHLRACGHGIHIADGKQLIGRMSVELAPVMLLVG